MTESQAAMEPTADKLASLLRRVRRAGVYRLPASLSPDRLRAAARAAGLNHVACDLADTRDLDAALATLGKCLDFPDWYGNNLDALNDCLTDLSWRDTPATVLVIGGGEKLCAALPEAFDALLSVFAAAVEYWQEDKQPFWILVDTPSTALPAFPLPT